MSLHLCLSNNHAEHKFTLLELTMKPQMKESPSPIEHDSRVARSLARRPPKQGFGQPLANMMSSLSTIKFRRLDLPMLKKSLMHDEWWCLWYCGIVDLWSVCVLAEGG